MAFSVASLLEALLVKLFSNFSLRACTLHTYSLSILGID